MCQTLAASPAQLPAFSALPVLLQRLEAALAGPEQGRAEGLEFERRLLGSQAARRFGDDAANPRFVRNERGVGYRMPRPGGR